MRLGSEGSAQPIWASTEGIRSVTLDSISFSQISRSNRDRFMGTFDFGDLGSRSGLPNRHERMLIRKTRLKIISLELNSILGSVQERLLNKFTFLFYLPVECIIESNNLVLVFGRNVVR